MKSYRAIAALLSIFLSVILMTACKEKVSEQSEKSNAGEVIETLNKENQFEQMYYQKIAYSGEEKDLDHAIATLKEQSGITNRSLQTYVQEQTIKPDTLIALYASKTVYQFSLYKTSQQLLKAHNYNLENLFTQEKDNLSMLFHTEELKDHDAFIFPYASEKAETLFFVWENAAGTQTYYALGDLEKAKETLNQNTPSTSDSQTLNRTFAIGKTYYQSVGILYDETNTTTAIQTLKKESGIQNREAVINTEISDGNALIAIYGEETISDLALYTIDQEKFAAVNYNDSDYVKKHLNQSQKIIVADTLTPTQYAVIRCSEPEGVPMYMIAWKNSNNQTEHLLITYNGKGES